jgi:hypothetical protein
LLSEFASSSIKIFLIRGGSYRYPGGVADTQKKFVQRVGKFAQACISKEKDSCNYVEYIDSCLPGRGYFAGLRVTKRNKTTVLLTLTLFQTPTLILT